MPSGQGAILARGGGKGDSLPPVDDGERQLWIAGMLGVGRYPPSKVLVIPCAAQHVLHVVRRRQACEETWRRF